MQKIARRVATAERVVAKRKKTEAYKSHRREKNQNFQGMTMQLRKAQTELRGAKQAIRNDWTMGSMSPRIDIGGWQDAHGSIGHARFARNTPLSFAAREARCQWAGGTYYLNLAVGDRVVLLDGPDKGRIGKVADINHETAEVTVAELNKSNIRLIEQMRRPQDPVAACLELPMPISAVRLVHPITDHTTGITQDVIINKLVRSGLVVDRQTGKRRWERVVPGLNVSIPWPPKEEPDLPDNKADTLRIDVEDRTFVPTLLRPPMPETIIDELRGKYSRFRTRHEPEYVARKEAEEQAEKDRAKLIESMRTPLQEFHRAEREKKKKKGKPRLTLEMLEKIGEVIARNREKALNAAGVPDSSPPQPPPPADVPPLSTNANTEPSAPPPSA